MCVWGIQQHTLIHGDHKTLRCYWRLVNQNKWCNGIKRLGWVNGFSIHMAADRVRIIHFWCQQRETLLYHISIVAEFSVFSLSAKEISQGKRLSLLSSHNIYDCLYMYRYFLKKLQIQCQATSWWCVSCNARIFAHCACICRKKILQFSEFTGSRDWNHSTLELEMFNWRCCFHVDAHLKWQIHVIIAPENFFFY